MRRPSLHVLDFRVPQQRWTLRRVRKALGLTQKEVAARMRVSQSWVSRLEGTHNPDLLSVKQYGHAIGADVRAYLYMPLDRGILELDLLRLDDKDWV